MTNSITEVVGTASDAAAGLTTVEEWLHRNYLEEEEIRTPLADSQYGSKYNIPRREGQSIKFTRRKKSRLPEKGREGADPDSGVPLGYEQVTAPMEWIKEWGDVTMEAKETSWLDLAKDLNEVMREALTRQLHALVQDCLWVGRYKPGRRNSSGLTTGVSPYFHFRAAIEATVSMYDSSFTFQQAPRVFTGGKSAFNQLNSGDIHSMDTYKSAKTRIFNGNAPRINGGVVAVISEGVKNDLSEDDRYFQAAIRNMKKSEAIFAGHIADYDGIHWVMADDTFTLALGGDKDVYVEDGEVHVSHMFAQDHFGYVRLGGANATNPRFKVQDVSKTGSVTTVGYSIPFQVAILQRKWGCSIAGPVRESASF